MVLQAVLSAMRIRRVATGLLGLFAPSINEQIVKRYDSVAGPLPSLKTTAETTNAIQGALDRVVQDPASAPQEALGLYLAGHLSTLRFPPARDAVMENLVVDFLGIERSRWRFVQAVPMTSGGFGLAPVKVDGKWQPIAAHHMDFWHDVGLAVGRKTRKAAINTAGAAAGLVQDPKTGKTVVGDKAGNPVGPEVRTIDEITGVDLLRRGLIWWGWEEEDE